MILMFFGDSLVNGTGDPSCLGWPGRCCIDAWRNGAQVTYYNLGVRAESSRMVLKRWAKEYEPRVLRDLPIGLVFSYGVGDSAASQGERRVPLQESSKNTREILEDATDLGKVLFVGPPPVLDRGHTERIHETSREIHRVCTELGVPFLDVLPPLLKTESYTKDLEHGDGVHPGADGYFKLAETVTAWDAWRDLVGK